MNASHQCVTTVEVGRPCSSSYGERWQSFKILFHQFADLPSAVGECTLSPEFTCSGHSWCLKLYPGGDTGAKTGKLSLFLRYCSVGRVKASYQACVLDKSQGHYYTKLTTDHRDFSGSKNWGWADFCGRSNILDKFLDDDGTLAVQVSIKTDSASPFVPRNPMSNMITGTFDDEETADVCFEVNSEVRADIQAESSPVTFYAHSLILKACAPMLASLFDSHDEKITTVSITDVEPAIFRHLLHYVYGGIVPEEEMKARAKDIINAADKYSIINLKLEAEAAYVSSTDITMENAIGDLLYADSMNCAFLKEVVVDYLMENSEEATEKLSFANVPGYIMKDLLFAINRSKKYKVGERNRVESKFNNLSVSELRRKLDEKGLTVDGSREVMIRALLADASSESADVNEDGSFHTPDSEIPPDSDSDSDSD